MEKTTEQNFIQVNGIMSKGYGFSPKAVMIDTRLTPEAKAIYAFMSSFAGAGLSAFPSIELQLKYLVMSKTRYYKHRKLLEQYGYITIKQTRIKNENGKSIVGKNIYTLEQFPIEREISEVPQNKETDESVENTNVSEVPQNEDTQNEDTQNEERNNNNLNNNNLNNNNINISSSSNSNNINNNINKTEKVEEEDLRVKDLLKLCKKENFKLKKADIESLLIAYDVSKIAKAIITASSTTTEIKNYKGYITKVLADMETVKPTTINVTKQSETKETGKHLRFNDFPQRDTDYDVLERRLLGWNDDDTEEQEEY